MTTKAKWTPGSELRNNNSARDRVKWSTMAGAAPQLYEALKTLTERVAHYAPQMATEDDLAESLAALAKARGEG